jgi:putative redox protein
VDLDYVIDVKWLEDREFVAQTPAGRALPVAGRFGFKPMELMLIGVAGCTAWDVVEILSKQRQRISGLTVSIAGRQREEPPNVFTLVQVRYKVRGHGLDFKAVQRAIKLSEDRYCSAMAMIKAVCPVETSWEIEEAKD